MDKVERRIAGATNSAVRRRNYRRIRDRALARLANLYPDQYKELFEEERERDETEGKVWLDISGRTNPGMDKTTPNRDTRNAKGLDNKVKARNLGGEA
jgi:hypothetical protein